MNAAAGRTDADAVVVGAGVVGLTVALRLAQAGRRVVVVEASAAPGGLAGSWTLPSPSGDGSMLACDRYYHVVLGADEAHRSVLRELEIEDRIQWGTTTTGASWDGTVASVSSPLDLLRFEALPPLDRLRLGVTVLGAGVVGRFADPERLDRMPLEPWLRKWSGDLAYERFWRPQLRAKLGTRHGDVSVAFLTATAQRLLRARGSGLGDERFGFLPGGTSTTVRALTDRLSSLGVELRTGSAVGRIARCGGARRLCVELGDGSTVEADDVVVTVTSSAAASMAQELLTQTEASALRSTRYQGVLCVALSVRSPVTPHYLTYLLDDSVLTGIVDYSALCGTDALDGGSVVYLPRYQAPDDPWFDRDDDEIVATFTQALSDAYPSFDPASIVGSKVARAREVFAVPTVGSTSTVPAHATSVEGLHLVNSSQIVGATLNVDESIRLAERGAASVLSAGARQVHAKVQTPAGGHAISNAYCSVSLDLDNEWSYLMVRGDQRWRDYPTYLPTVVPAALDVLRERAMTITFFLVGRDAEDDHNGSVLRSIVEAGHEVGNHSYQHEPWLHRYTYDQLVADFDRSEHALRALVGTSPKGFRGPGYSLAPHVLQILGERGYDYDASTLPSVLGPVSRAAYFRTARLDAAQRAERAELFGSFRDGLRPLRPYRWPGVGAVGGGVTEIPVTTMPILRTPIHVSYLLALAGVNARLAFGYLDVALALCARTSIAPSMLLHPLDFVGADAVPSLSFFPAMSMPTERKRALVGAFLDRIAGRFEMVTMAEHARRARAAELLPVRRRDPLRGARP